MKPTLFRSAFLILVGLVPAIDLLAQIGAPVPNWTVPPYVHRTDAAAGLAPMSDVTQPGVFIAVSPCRVVDTRGPAGPYGGPALTANVTRSFNIESGPCSGIAPLPGAFSLNFGAILPPADGFLTAWPVGTTQPTVSQLNLLGGEVVANAAIVPAGTSGSINVRSMSVRRTSTSISTGTSSPKERSTRTRASTSTATRWAASCASTTRTAALSERSTPA